MRIECPSGLIINAREFQGAELKAIATGADTKNGNTIASVLRSCWESTEDPGPYPFIDSDAFDWRRVVGGDVLAALIAHRVATFGPTFDFQAPCERCGERNEVEARLDEIEFHRMPAATFEKMRANEKLETRTKGGLLIRFELGTMRTEEYIRDQHKQMSRRPEWAGHTSSFLDGMAARITFVEGLDNKRGENVSKEFTKRLEWLLRTDAGTIYDLQAKMEEADCGLDTGVEFRCTSCRWEQKRDFPLGSAFFSRQPKKVSPTTNYDSIET